MTGRTFYLASAYNMPGKPGKGAEVARALIVRLERETGDRCTSRWCFDADHGQPGLGLMAATTDLQDVARANYVIAVPLNGTSRGTHFEMGLGIGLGKQVYLYSPKTRDPTAFDKLLMQLPERQVRVIEAVLEEFGFDTE